MAVTKYKVDPPTISESYMAKYKALPVDVQEKIKNDYLSNTPSGIIQSNSNKNFVKRLITPQNYPMIKNDDGSVSSHEMSSSDNIVYPNIVQKQGETELTRLEPKAAYKYARKTGEYYKAKNDVEANMIASNGYKQYFPQLLKDASIRESQPKDLTIKQDNTKINKYKPNNKK